MEIFVMAHSNYDYKEPFCELEEIRRKKNETIGDSC